MPDEPTLGEVVRRLDSVRQDLKEDINQLGKRMDSKVDQQVYDLRHAALEARVTAVERRAVEGEARIVATRRWIIGTIIIPVVGIALPLIVLWMGGKS